VFVRGAAAPEWAPDGRRLLVEGSRHTLVVDLASGRATRLPDHPGPRYWIDWSPDGSRLVFGGKRAKAWTAHDLLQVWVMEADGTHPRPITRSFGWMTPSWGSAD
jgi:Tol biopolymer transport system component